MGAIEGEKLLTGVGGRGRGRGEDLMTDVNAHRRQ